MTVRRPICPLQSNSGIGAGVRLFVSALPRVSYLLHWVTYPSTTRADSHVHHCCTCWRNEVSQSLYERRTIRWIWNLKDPVKFEVPTCASKRQDSFIGTYDRTSYPRRGRCITLAPSAPGVIPVIMKSRNTKVGISNLGEFLEEKHQVWRINKMLILSLL